MMQKENILEHVQIPNFKHLMFELEDEKHIVSIVDAEGYKITSGYGDSIIEAINDMHHNFI
jgi:hypothetical protein